MRQVLSASVMRSSWHRAPTLGMGRECGKLSFSPRCSCRSKKPASRRAAGLKGGDLTCPCSHASGLSFGLILLNRICHIRHIVKPVGGEFLFLRQFRTARCPGPAKVCVHACLANDWTMSVSVGVITAQMLQDARLTDIGAQGKQSTPSGAVDVEICLNALSTPRGSKQQSAGVYDPYDSAHQGEWERHSGRQPVRAGMRMAHYATISHAARSEDVHTLATNCDRSHAASCHGMKSEGDSDCTSLKKTLGPGGTRPCEVARE